MPNVRLDFQNPLNVSVQVGDVAYFSNPVPVGGVGNPTGSGQWASTTTPHLTSPQGDIIKIGEIIEIVPFNGAVSSIICDMPLNLFNLYITQIQTPVCITTPPTTIITPGTGTGTCANHIPRTDVEPFYFQGGINISTYPFHPVTGANISQKPYKNPMSWFFDNPSVNFNDVSFHTISEQTFNNGCLVSSSKSGYDADLNNYWYAPTLVQIITRVPLFNGDINGNPIPFPGTTNTISTTYNDFIIFAANNALTGIPIGTGSSGPTNVFGNTFQDVFDFVDTYFPGVTNSSMTYDDYWAALQPYGLSRPYFQDAGNNLLTGTAPVTTVTPATTTCVGDGSFIMFSKDNKVNLSSVLGYYASATFKNNSTEKAELFNVGVDVFESSK